VLASCFAFWFVLGRAAVFRAWSCTRSWLSFSDPRGRACRPASGTSRLRLCPAVGCGPAARTRGPVGRASGISWCGGANPVRTCMRTCGPARTPATPSEQP